MYPWKVYLTQGYLMPNSPKESWAAELYASSRDTSGAFNKNKLDDDTQEPKNRGFITRFNWFVSGRKVHILVPIMLDVAKSARLVPSGVSMRLELQRATTMFALQCDLPKIPTGTVPAIHIENPVLYCERYKLRPEIVQAVRSQIESGLSCKYVFDRMMLSMPVSVPIGATSFSWKLTNGVVPSVILVWFVNATAVNGSYADNPFQFENMNVTSCHAVYAGDMYPSVPYQSEFDP